MHANFGSYDLDHLSYLCFFVCCALFLVLLNLLIQEIVLILTICLDVFCWTDNILGRETFKSVTNFSSFLLDPSSGTLFLGARDAILAIDTKNLNQPPKKVKPEQTRVNLHVLGDVKVESGKGKCPFEPSQRYTAVMADGILYTAATSNFLGTSYDISRATGPEQERVRTEQSINWLHYPEFVSSAYIEQTPDSNPTGDDDKIYFFFTEMAKEHDLYTKVPRVVRVCKSDVGGMKTLQRRWTTFLKAQLVCEDKPSGQRYNILTDVFTARHSPGDPSSTHFYGLFTSQW
uniref:Semaphorin-4F-like n=1 Tax=Cyprinodon variegatus TaxID=28743 RepID=A0A3Q2EHQ8_CYPVA